MGIRRRRSDDALRSDAEILVSLRRRSPLAIAWLYDRYGAVAYSMAYAGTHDEVKAEAVVIDAFLSIWRGTVGYDTAVGGLGSWVATTVHELLGPSACAEKVCLTGRIDKAEGRSPARPGNAGI
jgi:hypothetical protein